MPGSLGRPWVWPRPRSWRDRRMISESTLRRFRRCSTAPGQGSTTPWAARAIWKPFTGAALARVRSSRRSTAIITVLWLTTRSVANCTPLPIRAKDPAETAERCLPSKIQSSCKRQTPHSGKTSLPSNRRCFPLRPLLNWSPCCIPGCCFPVWWTQTIRPLP